MIKGNKLDSTSYYFFLIGLTIVLFYVIGLFALYLLNMIGFVADESFIYYAITGGIPSMMILIVMAFIALNELWREKHD